MGAEGSEREVNRKAAVVVATVVGYPALIAVVLWWLLAPAASPAPMQVPDVPNEVQVASAVQQGVERSQVAIQRVEDLVPDVICHQVQVGETMIVKLIAGRDYYNPGKFELADAPEVADLALGVADVYGSFSNVRSEQFEVEVKATGTADAIPVEGGIDYGGPPTSCLAEGEYVTLKPGPNALDNKRLACARAAALAQNLMIDKKVLPIKIKLKGQTHGERGGQFRSVDVEITFIGLLRFAPDADFCG